jgi:hypothetical protein
MPSSGRPPASWLDARFDLTARGTTVATSSGPAVGLGIGGSF